MTGTATQDPTRPSTLVWWLEVLVLFVGYQSFEYLRTVTAGNEAVAARHARTIVGLERWTWTYHERAMQQWVLPHRMVVEGLDLYYGTVHFVVPPLVLVWLWRRFPERYQRWRNALIATTLVAMVGFVVYPLTPPRLMPSAFGFTDTMRTVGGLGPLDSGNFKDGNSFAAMPSLHLAWSTWCACALWSTVRRRWLKVAVFAYPATTFLVVIMTANHWILDGVAGWIVLGAGWWVSGLWAFALCPSRRRVVQG